MEMRQEMVIVYSLLAVLATAVVVLAVWLYNVSNTQFVWNEFQALESKNSVTRAFYLSNDDLCTLTEKSIYCHRAEDWKEKYHSVSDEMKQWKNLHENVFEAHKRKF